MTTPMNFRYGSVSVPITGSLTGNDVGTRIDSGDDDALTLLERFGVCVERTKPHRPTGGVSRQLHELMWRYEPHYFLFMVRNALTFLLLVVDSESRIAAAFQIAVVVD